MKSYISVIGLLITLAIVGGFLLFFKREEQDSRSSVAGSSSHSFQGGHWELMHKNIGISAMHMQLLHNNRVVIFDRTDFGESKLRLPANKCRHHLDKVLDVDCTAHSILFDITSNTFGPLRVLTNPFCSSGAVNPDGIFIQMGGYGDGDHKVRSITPCNDSYHNDSCDWIEFEESLRVRRWYASNHILPDGRIIVLGGRDNRGRAFSFEFFPKNSDNGVYPLKFLKETTDSREENNLYPFLHLLPDGNLFLFANNRSVVLDYKNKRIVKEFPPIPGEKRNYPATGSSVLLPLNLTGGLQSSSSVAAEVMICGGANGGAFLRARHKEFVIASKTCGRLRVTDVDPKWVMEEMPFNRVMPDMLLLPTGDVIIVNGASNGSAGWENADGPVLHPILYRPTQSQSRFLVLNPATIPRLYHSSAILLPDGRILVGGSNPHLGYNFTGVKFPTELSLESYHPPYLASKFSSHRPSIVSVEGGFSENIVSYNQLIYITVSIGVRSDNGLMVTMVAPSFTTHSFAMNQRLIILDIVEEIKIPTCYKLKVRAPLTSNIAPPGYYMIFVVHEGVPSNGTWLKLIS